MRKLFPVITLLLLSWTLAAQDYAQLDSLMGVYVTSIQREETESKTAETDYMIGAARDSLTRQHIALWLFDYYKASPLMGEEAVAIHIYDNWFAAGKTAFRSEFEEMDAKLFADFNRSSLLGMQAPVVTLRKPCGGKLTVPRPGRTALLWFYDTSCSKCTLEAKVLPGVLDGETRIPLDFYAVYSGQDKAAWKAFRRSFKLKNRNIKLIHLWDPEVESDYLRLYGVISTPRLYMVESRGSITGRRLEVENLPQMLSLAEQIESLYNNVK
ncbi:MAG: thioredoxin family protein [Bacteroidales bacterium]|nr:thioredoxin family protein [Bacteroidales bacterium]